MEKTGKIKSIASNGVTGVVTDNETGEEIDFIHPGANVEFVEGQEVTFIIVTTPSGHVIAREIKEEPVQA